VHAWALGRFCTSLGLFCGAAKYGALAFAEVTGGGKQGTESQRQLSLIHKRQAVKHGLSKTHQQTLDWGSLPGTYIAKGTKNRLFYQD
ncbi:MAG: hypothetical protein ACRESJ_23580, partial [Pseudomonas sp.]|uniref:hypothetical protein n=1 Tax=Pseudomonas sp. TaxID=306 RepID=UPI003D6DE0AC